MIKGAEKTLDSMYLTIPAQHLNVLSMGLFFFMALMGYLLTGNLWFTILGAALALPAPWVILSALKKRRHKRFGIQLATALSQMGNALKAGQSLQQAINLVHEEMPNPIAQEFRLLSHELHFGTDIVEALRNLSERMPGEDLTLMVTAVDISTEVGGNLAEVFDTLSNTIRDRQTLESKVSALTAQGRMQGIVLCSIPVGLCALLSLFFPGMMDPLFTTQIGWATLALCTIMIGAGWFTIQKMVKVDF